MLIVFVLAGWAGTPRLQAQTAGTGIVSVLELGAFPDGTNPDATTKAFRTAFSQYPNGKIIVPPGTYAIDNSAGALYIQNFQGELKFEGGAVLLFLNLIQGGLRFQYGQGARIIGLRTNYAGTPTVRAGTVLSFTEMSDVTLEDATLMNSPGAAVLFTNCIRPKATNIVTNYALADGLIFANCEDAHLTNLTTIHTLDNGLAFYGYENLPDRKGGVVRNVHVRESYAHGIAVLGVSNVVISGFTIDGTRGSAVFVGSDPYYYLRASDHVTIEHGYVKNPGTLQPPGGTLYGIEYNKQISCVFSDIEIEGAPARAVSGSSVNGRVYLRNIRVKGNKSQDAFVFYQTAYVEISDSYAENIAGAGFVFNQVPTVIANRLTATNTSQASTLNRAYWFQDGRYIAAQDLNVVDTQGTATGFIIGASQSTGYTQSGSIQSVMSTISNGALKVQNYSPAISVVDVN